MFNKIRCWSNWNDKKNHDLFLKKIDKYIKYKKEKITKNIKN